MKMYILMVQDVIGNNSVYVMHDDENIILLPLSVWATHRYNLNMSIYTTMEGIEAARLRLLADRRVKAAIVVWNDDSRKFDLTP